MLNPFCSSLLSPKVTTRVRKAIFFGSIVPLKALSLKTSHLKFICLELVQNEPQKD